MRKLKGHMKFESSNLKRLKVMSGIWIKVAVGALTGLATIAALGGFSKKNSECKQNQFSDEIPDEILDGPIDRPEPEEDGRQRSRDFRDKAEKNVRGFQDALSKISSIIGSLSIAVTNIMRVFYEDPYERISPTTVIY
jgi:hypothetical protein